MRSAKSLAALLFAAQVTGSVTVGDLADAAAQAAILEKQATALKRDEAVPGAGGIAALGGVVVPAPPPPPAAVVSSSPRQDGVPVPVMQVQTPPPPAPPAPPTGGVP